MTEALHRFPDLSIPRFLPRPLNQFHWLQISQLPALLLTQWPEPALFTLERWRAQQLECRVWCKLSRHLTREGVVALGLERGKATLKHHGRRPPPPHNLAPLSKHLQAITQNINNTMVVSQCCSANLTPLKKQTKGQENISGALIFSVLVQQTLCVEILFSVKPHR